MNNLILNVQLTPDEISIIANSLSYELWITPSMDAPHKKELEKLYEKLNAFVLPISFSFEDEI